MVKGATVACKLRRQLGCHIGLIADRALKRPRYFIVANRDRALGQCEGASGLDEKRLVRKDSSPVRTGSYQSATEAFIVDIRLAVALVIPLEG